MPACRSDVQMYWYTDSSFSDSPSTGGGSGEVTSPAPVTAEAPTAGSDVAKFFVSMVYPWVISCSCG